MPSLFLDRSPSAPALVRAAVETAGYSARTVDFNLSWFWQQCEGNMERFNQLGCVFRNSEVASEESLQAADQWIDQTVKYIEDVNPKLLGLSAFSVQQHRSIFRLTQAVRQKLPRVKIVLGGLGLNVGCSSLSTEPGFRKIDLVKPFYQYMQDQQLVDHVVLGQALDDLISVMEKEIGPATNHLAHESDSTIFSTPVPNYNDYKLEKYLWNEGKYLPVTGSKGCVRNCTFCDVPGQFGRFRYRTGQDIANEIIYLHEKYGVKVFEFTDSLVNGSLKAFREWLVVLAEYNASKPADQKIQWFGQYICRPQSQTPNDIYKLMAASGVQNLVIGVESGSDAVLHDMRKKMKVQDVYDELEQFYQNGIKTTLLMMSGYHSETQEDFLKTLEFLVELRTWVARGVVSKISVGSPLYINDKMYLYQAADELGIINDATNDFNWTVTDNPENDYPWRSLNRLIAQLLLDKLGISMCGVSQLVMYSITKRLEKLEQDLVLELEQLKEKVANVQA
jgi:hypothetical protein